MVQPGQQILGYGPTRDHLRRRGSGPRGRRRRRNRQRSRGLRHRVGRRRFRPQSEPGRRRVRTRRHAGQCRFGRRRRRQPRFMQPHCGEPPLGPLQLGPGGGRGLRRQRRIRSRQWQAQLRQTNFAGRRSHLIAPRRSDGRQGRSLVGRGNRLSRHFRCVIRRQRSDCVGVAMRSGSKARLARWRRRQALLRRRQRAFQWRRAFQRQGGGCARRRRWRATQRYRATRRRRANHRYRAAADDPA